MKKLAILFVFLCLNSVCTGACPEQIKAFYTAYLNNILQDNAHNTALCNTYFTEELIEKVHRLKNATGADPVIRAQDTTKDAVETLSIKELGGDWYLVQYFWENADSNSLTEIPLKAQTINGRCKISYIIPYWHGSRYGDELSTCGNGATTEIDRTSEMSFLKTFYNAYTALYCAMPKALNAKLASLRSRYLSQKALEQFKQAAADNLADGLEGYDLLIDNFDFDCQWRKNIEITHLNGKNYQIIYTVDNHTYKTLLSIAKGTNGYLIDNLTFYSPFVCMCQ